VNVFSTLNFGGYLLLQCHRGPRRYSFKDGSSSDETDSPFKLQRVEDVTNEPQAKGFFSRFIRVTRKDEKSPSINVGQL